MTQSSTKTGFAAIRILVVDDHVHMRTILCSVLKGVGIDSIQEAWNGADALEIVRSWRPDVAIVDLLMHPIDGVEFTRLVRRGSAKPDLPIIMVSGQSDSRHVADARDAGVNEFLAKPISAGQLLKRLDRVILFPRRFVKCESYVGPDRRRRRAVAYTGPRRREDDLG